MEVKRAEGLVKHIKPQNRCAKHLQTDTSESDSLARQLKHKRDINVQTPSETDKVSSASDKSKW